MVKMTKEVGRKFFERYRLCFEGDLDSVKFKEDPNNNCVSLELVGYCFERYELYPARICCHYVEANTQEIWDKRFEDFMIEEFGDEYVKEVEQNMQIKLDYEIAELKRLHNNELKRLRDKLEEIKGKE